LVGSFVMDTPLDIAETIAFSNITGSDTPS
jgi:hypothetical protein